jgi:hypothetical protein
MSHPKSRQIARELPDRHTRIQRTVGILENHLEAFAARAKLTGGKMRDVCAFKADRPGRGLEQADDRAAERSFSTAAFANEAECFVGREIRNSRR